MKVIIGAGNVQQEGWLATQESQLDLLEEDSWQHFFNEQRATALLAEHVWEHLTYEEGLAAAKNCYNYLEPGGYLRIAVPDKYFRNKVYQELVQIGGPGPKDHPAAGHKVLYDYQRLASLLTTAGFDIDLLEYCDEEGQFHYHYWNPDDGKIGRSFRYDTRNSMSQLGMVSIIIDAYKPLTICPK